MKYLSLILSLGLLAGCSSMPVVERVAVDEVIDYSGKFNDSDATMIAEEMITDVLAKPWREEFLAEAGKSPTVIIGHVVNRTHEHIDTQLFTKSLERELLNSGKVQFVASPSERGQMRAEREDQQLGFTDSASMAEIGRERGADFMLIGSMNAVKDEVKKKSVVLYQANLEMINLTDNTKVWIGQKEIKKTVEKKRFSL